MERLERGAGGGGRANLNPEIQDILFTLRPKTFFKAIKLFFCSHRTMACDPVVGRILVAGK